MYKNIQLWKSNDRLERYHESKFIIGNVLKTLINNKYHKQ